MSKYLAVFGKPRYLGIVEYDGEIKKGDRIIVESHRGEELAVVAGELTQEQETEYRQMRNASEHGDNMSKNGEPVVTDLRYAGSASDDDVQTQEDYRNEEKDILVSAKLLLTPHDLDMKLIDVEFLRDKRKLFFYFSSEQRVDFRAYVRDLAREFKTRIELRQIGVRDEAKIIRGIGPCGQPCCCSYWLNQFAPICIKMVKEQNLALNPAKISGICGRLMCCMCFEHNVYHELWANLPNPGTKIKTPNGNVVVSGIEIATKKVQCYIPGRGEVKIPIEQFEEFKKTVTEGREWIIPDVEEAVPIPKLQNIFPDYFPQSGEVVKKEIRKSEEPRSERRRPQREERNDAAQREEQPSQRKRRRPRKPLQPPVDTQEPTVDCEPQPDKPRRPKRRRPSGQKKRRDSERGQE